MKTTSGCFTVFGALLAISSGSAMSTEMANGDGCRNEFENTPGARMQTYEAWARVWRNMTPTQRQDMYQQTASRVTPEGRQLLDCAMQYFNKTAVPATESRNAGGTVYQNVTTNASPSAQTPRAAEVQQPEQPRSSSNHMVDQHEGFMTDLCIVYKPTHRSSSNELQYYEFTNKCSETINVWASDGRDLNIYGSKFTLKPGRTDGSWWLLKDRSSIQYLACREKMPNGEEVFLDKKSLSCSYRRRLPN